MWRTASGVPMAFFLGAGQVLQQAPPGVFPMAYAPGPFFPSAMGYPMPILQNARFDLQQVQPRMLPRPSMPPAPNAGFSPDGTEFEVTVLRSAVLDQTSDSTPTARGKAIGPVAETAQQVEHSRSKAKEVQRDVLYRHCDGDDEGLSAAHCLLQLVDGVAEEVTPGA